MRDTTGHEHVEPFGPPEWSEAIGEPETVSEARPSDESEQYEPEPDRSGDPAWIRVETAEYEAGHGAAAGFNIATGRIFVTYRLRKLPEEAELDHVKGKPYFPIPLEVPTEREPQGRERDSDWKPGVDPQLLRRYLTKDEHPQRSDSTSVFRWGGHFGR